MKSLTLGSKEQVDDAIACITSTAEQIATFKESISACKKQTSYNSSFQKIKFNYLYTNQHTLAPPVTGRRRVLASKSSTAPANEVI